MLAYAVVPAFDNTKPKCYCQNQSEEACPCLTLLGYRCVTTPASLFSCMWVSSFPNMKCWQDSLSPVRLALVLNVSGSARCDNTCNLVTHSVGKRGQPSWLYLHRLILSTLFYSIVGWSDFMILPYCFDYYSFVILFEIKKEWYFQLCSLSNFLWMFGIFLRLCM